MDLRQRLRSLLLVSLPFWVLGCGSSVAAHPAAAAPPAHASSPTDDDAVVARVSTIHGGAGPWVIAGYRMGQFALARLGLEAQSFDLDVVHHSPHAVQVACIADGAAAATGASVGKLNLRMVDDALQTATTYTRRSTKQHITLRPTEAFVTRYRDVPRAELAPAGREVLRMRDEEIFEIALPE